MNNAKLLGYSVRLTLEWDVPIGYSMHSVDLTIDFLTTWLTGDVPTRIETITPDLFKLVEGLDPALAGSLRFTTPGYSTTARCVSWTRTSGDLGDLTITLTAAPSKESVEKLVARCNSFIRLGWRPRVKAVLVSEERIQATTVYENTYDSSK